MQFRYDEKKRLKDKIKRRERSRRVDVPFDNFYHRKWPNLAKMSKNSVFFLSKNELVRARTFECSVIETWL